MSIDETRRRPGRGAPQLTFKDRGREIHAFRTRLIVSAAVMVVLMLTLVARLVSLQVVQHGHFTTLSQENRVKIVPIAPTRGLIFSRDGLLLAENRPSFSLELVPERVKDLAVTLEGLAAIVEIRDEDLDRFNRALRQKRRFDSVPLRFNLTDEEVARFSIDRHRYPGVEIVAQLTRHYPAGSDYAHVVGYVGRIDEDDLRRIDGSNYAATNHIGKLGVENTYEEILHGRVGYQQVEVNAQGRILRVLDRRPPEPGKDLYLAIDSELQQAAVNALGGKKGAVVAIEPETGRVLAMVSKPGFDPNPFVNGIGAKLYASLRDSPDRPLFNRALQGKYPPGSTIKPMVALAGLEAGVRSPRQGTWCRGWYSLPGQSHRYRDWKKGGHGTVDVYRAVAESCDVYFYDLAHDLGIDRLHDYMSRFGFGRVTGIDLPGESAALMPSRAWKRDKRRLPWYPGETLIAGIGQGFWLSTPLQLAQATAVVARRGVWVPPRVVGQIEDTVTRHATEPATAETVAFQSQRPENWQVIIDAMNQVVQGPAGTARRTGLDAPYRYAGKTGTAQLFNIKQGEEYDEKNVPEELKDHALFVAFAPIDNPQIAIGIIVENGGSGSGAAAPIARTLFDLYLLDEEAPTPVADRG